MTTKAFYAKCDFGRPATDPPVAGFRVQPVALFCVADGLLSFYFDKRAFAWVFDASVLHLTLEDAELEAITAQEAATIEAAFRAVRRPPKEGPVR